MLKTGGIRAVHPHSAAGRIPAAIFEAWQPPVHPPRSVRLAAYRASLIGISTRVTGHTVLYEVPPHRSGHVHVMSNDRASEAREGLFGNVAGKAKEVAGAVAGKDDLVQEGQLQQEEARNRKEAVAEEAIADAKREEATDQYREDSREAAELKDRARVEADREKSAAEGQRASEERAAEREAALREAAAREAAEERADELAESRLRDAEMIESDADATEVRAAADARAFQRDAAAAEQQAAHLRAEANK